MGEDQGPQQQRVGEKGLKKVLEVTQTMCASTTMLAASIIAGVGTLDNMNRIEVFLSATEFQKQKAKAKEVVMPRGKEEVTQGTREKGVVEQLPHQPQTFPPHHPLCSREVQVQSGRVRQT